jgi:class 3 adenylate cyclase
MFAFKGFAEPTPVYRIQQRHRTLTIADTYIQYLDLTGFHSVVDAEPAGTTVERILDTLDGVTHMIAQQFGGHIRFSLADSYCITFGEAGQAIAAAEGLSLSWDASHQEVFGCGMGIGLHRGTIYTFRSFLYGRDVRVAVQLRDASAKLLTSGENGIFATSAFRDALFGTAWHNRLQPVELKPLAGIESYRLCDATARRR